MGTIFPPITQLCPIDIALVSNYLQNVVQHIMVPLPIDLPILLESLRISTGLSGISTAGRGREQGRGQKPGGIRWNFQR